MILSIPSGQSRQSLILSLLIVKITSERSLVLPASWLASAWPGPQKHGVVSGVSAQPWSPVRVFLVPALTFHSGFFRQFTHWEFPASPAAASPSPAAPNLQHYRETHQKTTLTVWSINQMSFLNPSSPSGHYDNICWVHSICQTLLQEFDAFYLI